MTDEKIQATIEEFIGDYPVCEYFHLKTSELTMTSEVKELSQQDAAVYTERRKVPPAPEKYEKCLAEVESYSDAFLFDAVYEVDDAYDLERCAQARADHAALTRELCDAFRQRFGEILTLSISCDQCEECPCPKRPCPHREKRIFSMDSYGMQIMKTLADRDITYDYGIHTAIYFTVILFRGEEAK